MASTTTAASRARAPSTPPAPGSRCQPPAGSKRGWSRAAAVLGLAFVGNGFGLGLSNVLAVSLRQAVTPDRLLGRMNASYRFLTYGAVPVGALLGGALGELLGLRAAVAVGAVGSLLTVPWALARPLPGLRRMPAQSAPR
jgi:hypothetical protein